MKNKPCIVFDTNTYISALILPDSITKQTLDYAILHFTLVVCEDTWMELENKVTEKASLQRYFESPQVREDALRELNALVSHVTVHSVVEDCRDPKDNKFLALAIDTQAQFIVTGDKDLLVLHPWRGIEIVTPGDFCRNHAAQYVLSPADVTRIVKKSK